MPLVVLQAAMVVLWSSGFIGSVFASDTGALYGLIAWRFVVFAALLVPFVRSAVLAPGQILRDSVVGTLAIFGYLIGISAAVDLGVSIGTAAIISALQPVATAAATSALGSERTAARQWAGLMLGLVGVGVAVGFHPTPAPALGYAAAVLGTASLVAGSLIAKADPNPLPFAAALWVRSTAAAALFLAVAAFRGELFPPPNYDTLFALGWWVVIATVGGFGAYFLCLKRLSATQTANLTYLTVPVTAVWALVVFGQSIGTHDILAAAVCFVGVALASPAGLIPASVRRLTRPAVARLGA